MKKRLWVPAFVLLTTALSACAGGAGALYVRTAPPPPRYAVVGVAPGPGYVWTNGFWDWRGSRWVWVEGRWMRAPRPHAVWVAPEWRQEGRRWRYHRGYWR